MATKLWEKNFEVNREIERFTVGRDRELDLYLARYDVLGSMAHITMLQSIGLMEKDELDALLVELKKIYRDCVEGRFEIEEGVEDVHSQVELMLTRRLGDMGKKIHSGRSRNDQVLVDLKLFIRHELHEVADEVMTLFNELLEKSEQCKDVLMPGYTHLQIAMPSSFGLWFGAYAESLADDMLFLQAAYRMANRNPLGSAAGYGSSFPLDRSMTTRLLGFDSMDYNVVYAQMGRGKTERNVAFAMASVAGTLSKMAFDACMFNCQNFGFVKLPKECTTGSSIMPHKKNPDVFELIRAKCNKLQGLPAQITLIMNNLPVGYFRDLQIIKEVFLPAFGELKDCLRMAAYIINKMEVNRSILDNPMYDPMFSVEEVNRLAAAGMPFRDAYRKVGMEIENGTYRADHHIHHTHEGSMGNLCNDRIAEYMRSIYDAIGFDRAENAEKELLKWERNCLPQCVPWLWRSCFSRATGLCRSTAPVRAASCSTPRHILIRHRSAARSAAPAYSVRWPRCWKVARSITDFPQTRTWPTTWYSPPRTNAPPCCLAWTMPSGSVMAIWTCLPCSMPTTPSALTASIRTWFRWKVIRWAWHLRVLQHVRRVIVSTTWTPAETLSRVTEATRSPAIMPHTRRRE